MAELASTPERSLVTIVVVDTVGSTKHIAGLDPDDAQTLLDDVYMHIRRTIERAGGLLVSFAGDGGVAVFGWPGSQEDHADRACAAAWEVHNPAGQSQSLIAPNGKPIEFRVGIHSGLVGLRQLHLEGGAVLDLVGGTVHLAAALEKRAPVGETLVSSKTVQLCRSHLELLDVEGFPQLEQLGVSPYRLMARPHRLNARDLVERYKKPLVGRDHIASALFKLVPKKGASNSSAVVIGDPGLGKSHLIAAAIRETQAKAYAVDIFVQNGESRTRSTPLATMRALLAQTLEIDAYSSSDALDRALTLKNIVLEETEQKLFDQFWSADETALFSNPAKLRTLLIRLFLKSAVRRPALIVVEDLHNVDPETIACLQGMLVEETAYPVSLLVSGRPEAMDKAQSVSKTILNVETLDARDMHEIAKQHRGADSLDDKLIQGAVDRSGGVPFVLEQIMASLLELGEAALTQLPEGVENVIHARLNQLTDTTKAVAQGLSVLGESVELELATQALAIPAGALQSSLTELTKFDIIHPPLGNNIQFRHAILADACAHTVGRERREELHQNAYSALCELHDNLDAHHERLANHAEQKGDDTLALSHLWQAAKIASRTWSTGSLKMLFERALPCIERMGDEGELPYVDFVLLTYTPTLQLGEFTELTSHLPKALAIATKHNLPAKICGTQCQLAILAWFEGRYEEGLKIAQEATQLAEELQSPPLIFSAKFTLAGMYHGLAKLNDAIRVQTELVEYLDGDLRNEKLGGAGIPAAISTGYLSWYYMEIGRYEEGLPYAKLGVSIADKSNDPYSRLLTRLGLGRNLLMLERVKEAEKELVLAFELGLDFGFRPVTTHLGGLLMSAKARLGKGREAVIIAKEIFDQKLDRHCSELERFYLYCGYAEALHTSGDHCGSMAACGKALDSALAINNQCLIAQGLGLKARLLIADDPENQEGLESLEKQQSLCARYGLVPWQPKDLGVSLDPVSPIPLEVRPS